jgi:hypothetical protein
VIDVDNARGPWWTPLEVKESSDDVRIRFRMLWSFLQFGTSAETVILVGHSHFFRFMMNEYMSAAFRSSEPEWAEKLSVQKLDNGACLRVSLSWEHRQDPMAAPVINAARLVFGSQLVDEEEEHEKKKLSRPSFGSRIMKSFDKSRTKSPSASASASPVRVKTEPEAGTEAGTEPEAEEEVGAEAEAGAEVEAEVGTPPDAGTAAGAEDSTREATLPTNKL